MVERTQRLTREHARSILPVRVHFPNPRSVGSIAFMYWWPILPFFLGSRQWFGGRGNPEVARWWFEDLHPWLLNIPKETPPAKPNHQAKPPNQRQTLEHREVFHGSFASISTGNPIRVGVSNPTWAHENSPREGNLDQFAPLCDSRVAQKHVLRAEPPGLRNGSL